MSVESLLWYYDKLINVQKSLFSESFDGSLGAASITQSNICDDFFCKDS